MDGKSSTTLDFLEGDHLAVFLALHFASTRSILVMNVKDARRARLRELLDKEGTLRNIARTVSPGKKYLDRYLGQIINGDRDMGDPLARDFEAAYRKHEGWMDHVGASSKESGELLHIWGQFPEAEQHRILEELKIRLRVIKDNSFISQDLISNHEVRRKPSND